MSHLIEGFKIMILGYIERRHRALRVSEAVVKFNRWLLNDHRHRRDDERLTVNRAAMIQIRMIRLLWNRLA